MIKELCSKYYDSVIYPENGKYILIVYKNQKIVEKRMYNTFRGANIAQTILLKKHNII